MMLQNEIAFADAKKYDKLQFVAHASCKITNRKTKACRTFNHSNNQPKQRVPQSVCLSPPLPDVAGDRCKNPTPRGLDRRRPNPCQTNVRDAECRARPKNSKYSE